MILDTDAAYDAIFPPPDMAPAQYISCGSNRMLGVRTVNGRMVVDSLFSTNPFDYLNPAWTPGSDLSGKSDGLFD